MPRPTLALALFALLLGSAVALPAQQTLAATPPMGWNSWDSWGYTITGPEFKKTAAYMHRHLQKYGWQYMIIDEGWFARHPENADVPGKSQDYVISGDSLYLPAPNRFPGGLKEVADYVHSFGLKFGIHIVHGIPRPAVDKNLPIAGSRFHADDAADRADVCSWNTDNYGVKDNAAGQAYYDSMLKMYAGWGLDFIKVDCISKPYHQGEIEMIHRAIAKTGRPIVLSLSPGPTPLADGSNVEQNANMWRISDDFWDVWYKPAAAPTFPQAVTRQFGLLAGWTPYRSPGHWPDADMLPLGTLEPHPGWGKPRLSRLTHEEERTVFTLWSIAQSPLIMGGNLLMMDPFTLSLLTNPEVIAANQRSSDSRQLPATGDTRVWTATAPDGDYVALFNLSDQPKDIVFNWKDLQLSGRHPVRDLWARKDLGALGRIAVTLPPHACRLFKVEAARSRWGAPSSKAEN